MSKFWKVAFYEYTRNVFRKSFIIALLSVPLMIGVTVALVVIMIAINSNDAPVGYVDHAGLLADPLPALLGRSEKPVEFIPFDTEEEAREALESERIQVYYVLSSDYLETGRVELVYFKEPGENASGQFYDFLQVNLVSDQPPEIVHRVAEGTEVLIRTPGSDREFSSRGPGLDAVLPMILSVAFVFLLLMSSGYLMQAVVDEKENRTMEVLVTSLSPTQLIGGKVLGIVAISFTQLVTWVMVAILAVFVSGGLLGIPWFQNVSLNWGSILMVVVIAIPSYVFASALMVALGSTITEAHEAQTVGGLFGMLYMVPLWGAGLVLEHPNNPLAVALSLIPFTSLTTVGFRTMISVVPVWQVVASAAIQTLFAIGALWLAGRAFRMGMLRYGQRLRLSEILGMVRAVRTQGQVAQGDVS